MKATLEFNLPEEKSEFTIASNAELFYGLLEEVHSTLNRCAKNEKPLSVFDCREIAGEIFDVIFLEGIE